MARFIRFVMVLAVVLVPPASAVIQGQGRPVVAASPRIHRYGEVTLSTLPAAAPRSRRVVPFRPIDPARFNEQKTAARRSSQLAAVPGAALASSSITVDENAIDGVTFGDSGVIPPDTQVAVSSDYILEAVNTNVRVWSRQTSPPSVVYDTDLGTFFGVGFWTTLTDVISDPRVFFDPGTGRWFVSVVTLESLLNTGDWRIAVSKTSDPTGAYTLYGATFQGSFPDFPSLGVSDDKVALTGNSYTLASQAFLGAVFLVASKADMIAGLSDPADQFFSAQAGIDSIQAALSLSSGSTLFMAAVPAAGPPTTTLQLWTIDGVPGVGSGVSVSTVSRTMQTSLVVPPDAVQAGSSTPIATNDQRLLHLVYRNGSLWAAGHTGCTPAGDNALRACLHFAQVATSTLGVTQEILFGETATDYYYPAIAVDVNGNLVTVFDRSSASEFVSVYASGQNAGDGAGTFQSPILLKAGLAAYEPTGYAPRWGDYSGAALDPADGGLSVWVAGEYMRADGGFDWGTWISRIHASTTCTAPLAPTGVTATAGDAQIVLGWSAVSGAANYNVKRANVGGGPYTTIATVATTSYADSSVVNGTPYYYVVSAANGCGESADSTEVSSTPQAPLPLAPTRLNATAAKGKITLRWAQPTSGTVTANNVYRSTSDGGPYTLVQALAATTSCTDNQVIRGTVYYYVVTAVTTAGESPYSNQASAKAK